MKLKQQPDDFQVEELTDVLPGKGGPFAFYRLEKRGWTTVDAVGAIRRRWQIDHRRVSYGGLKDRHAHTVQYLTVLHGPRRGLEHNTVTLTYLGQLGRPYRSDDIRANRFRITLRELRRTQIEEVRAALEEVRTDGVPNYFGDQRFGSAGPEGAFPAQLMVLGRWEEALRLALAAPYIHDSRAQKEEKAILQECWGDWPACQARLPRGHARRLVDYLVSHPTDFRGAVARLRPELNGLFLSAYQSHLWNRALARWLTQLCRPEQLLRLSTRLTELPAHRALDPEQQAALADFVLPFPSARMKLDPADPRASLLEAVVAEEGFPLSEMKLRGLREPFFSRGDRPALCQPSGLTVDEAKDERHPGSGKLVLAFELPRGSYATVIVKRLQAS